MGTPARRLSTWISSHDTNLCAMLCPGLIISWHQRRARVPHLTGHQFEDVEDVEDVEDGKDVTSSFHAMSSVGMRQFRIEGGEDVEGGKGATGQNLMRP